MRQPISFAWAMAVVLFLGSDAWARRVFEFDFAGPEKIEAAPGASVDVEVTAQLVARGVESPEAGVEAWSMAIRVSGASISSLDVDGVPSTSRRSSCAGWSPSMIRAPSSPWITSTDWRGVVDPSRTR